MCAVLCVRKWLCVCVCIDREFCYDATRVFLKVTKPRRTVVKTTWLTGQWGGDKTLEIFIMNTLRKKVET